MSNTLVRRLADNVKKGNVVVDDVNVSRTVERVVRKQDIRIFYWVGGGNQMYTKFDVVFVDVA